MDHSSYGNFVGFDDGQPFARIYEMKFKSVCSGLAKPANARNIQYPVQDTPSGGTMHVVIIGS